MQDYRRERARLPFLQPVLPLRNHEGVAAKFKSIAEFVRYFNIIQTAFRRGVFTYRYLRRPEFSGNCSAKV